MIKCRLRREFKDKLNNIASAIVILSIILAAGFGVFIGFGFILVQVLGFSPAIPVTSAMEYYTIVGMDGFVLIIVTVVLGVWAGFILRLLWRGFKNLKNVTKLPKYIFECEEK